MGYDLGVITKALPDVAAFFKLSIEEEELVTSLMLIGCVFGSLIGGTICDYFGRKITVYLVALIFLVGSIIIAMSYSYSSLLAGRFIVGLGVAISAIVDVSYLSEVSPPEWRGMIVSANELCITVGFLLAFFIGYIVSPLERGWRLMFGFPVIISACWIVLMFNLPESPRWLLVNHRSEDAMHVFRTIHGGNDDVAVKEYEAALMSVEATRAIENRHTLLHLLCRVWLLPMVVAVGLMMSQQFTGNAAVLTYAPELLVRMGESTSTAGLMTVILGVVKVVFTLISLTIVDWTGRRPLLLTGIVGMVVGYVVLASSVGGPGTTSPIGGNSALTKVAVGAIVGFYALGFGPVTWLIVSELFPDDIRGRAIGIATVSNWLANALVVGTYLSIIDLYGDASTFAIFAVACLVGAVFAYVLVPETQMREVTDIRHELLLRCKLFSPCGWARAVVSLATSCCPSWSQYTGIASPLRADRSDSEIEIGDGQSVESDVISPISPTNIFISVVPAAPRPVTATI